MIRLVIFGEALTYPPKDGISAHVYSLLDSLAESRVVKPILVVADRGYVAEAQYTSMPWEVYLVPPQHFYDYSYMSNLLCTIKPDIVQSYDIYQARLIGSRFSNDYGVPLVMEHHDLEANRAKFLTLPPGIGEKNAISQQEIAQYASLNRVMSYYDYTILKNQNPERADHFICLPVAVKDDFASMPMAVTPSTRDILFIGNGAYPPNHQAMQFIIEELAPNMPNYTFHIAGRHSDQLAGDAGHNVIGYGMIDNLSTLAQKCFCGIAPLTSGSGMKIKILTYISAHLPVVATPVALQGFQDKDFYITSQLDSFSEAIIQLSNSPDRTKLSSAARDHYVDFYSPERQRSLIEQHYRRLHTTDAKKLSGTPLQPIERDDSRLFWLHEERNEKLSITNVLQHFDGAAS